MLHVRRARPAGNRALPARRFRPRTSASMLDAALNPNFAGGNVGMPAACHKNPVH